MFGTSISPSDRNARENANKQALDFLYGRTGDVFSWNLYQERSTNALLPSRGGFIPGFASPFNTRCARSSDCGQGYFCNQGVCEPVGTGLTGNDSEGGCSTGPNENGGIGGSDTCGSSSGTGNLGKCASPGCGSGGPQDCDGGPRCCRFTATSIQCWNGRCREPADGNCSGYCSGYRTSFGSNGSGCSDSNSCTECSTCISGQCVKKTENVPCHCDPKADDNCGRPGEPLTCCNYKDTCNGRIILPPGQTYCHPTYRTWFPRCYDPEVPCDEGPGSTGSCVTCTTGTSSIGVPLGCTQTGFIRNEDTGEETYLYQCCTNITCEEGISYSFARWTGSIYGAGGSFGTPLRGVTTAWRNISNGESLGWYMSGNQGGPWVGNISISASGMVGLLNPPCNAQSPFVGGSASLRTVASDGTFISSTAPIQASSICPGFSGAPDRLHIQAKGSFQFSNSNVLDKPVEFSWEGKQNSLYNDDFPVL